LILLRKILPNGVQQGQWIVFIPGYNLGNFEPLEITLFPCRICELMSWGLLVGIDRKNDPFLLNAAYNDDASITIVETYFSC
jgi:uncharacterized SAM-dependent methyltransferase